MRKILKKYLFFFFLCGISCLSNELFTQEAYRLTLFSENEKIILEQDEVITFDDTTNLINSLDKLVSDYHSRGFLLASIDSFRCDTNKHCYAYFSKGEKYNYVIADLDDGKSLRRNVRSDFLMRRPAVFKPGEYISELEDIIRFYENIGYPFARVKPEKQKQTGDTIFVNINIIRGPYIKIDSILLRGETLISPRFIYPFFEIKKGDEYREELILEMDDKVQRIPFLESYKSPALQIRDNKTWIYTYLKEVKASNFSGIVGFQPNDETENKLVLTGEVNLKLLNIFHRGERFDFQWQRLRPQTQKLNVGHDFPFLFQTPFGISAHFSLFKNDSSFLDNAFKLGINARWNGLNRVGAGYSARSSISLLENDLQSGYNSFKERGYYLDAYINSLDYVYNPRKGWLIEFFVEAGKRERKHEAKNAKNYVKVHAQADRFFQLFNKSALRVRTISGWQNGRNFFYNEMQRLGGFNSFRGLDEDALFASAYSIMTLEYRFLFEEKSNVNVFTDLAYYEADRIENRISDTPVSFGIGVQLQTGAGIIRFSYALAREFDNSFKFRNAKFHIGLINEF